MTHRVAVNYTQRRWNVVQHIAMKILRNSLGSINTMTLLRMNKIYNQDWSSLHSMDIERDRQFKLDRAIAPPSFRTRAWCRPQSKGKSSRHWSVITSMHDWETSNRATQGLYVIDTNKQKSRNQNVYTITVHNKEKILLLVTEEQTLDIPFMKKLLVLDKNHGYNYQAVALQVWRPNSESSFAKKEILARRSKSDKVNQTLLPKTLRVYLIYLTN